MKKKSIVADSVSLIRYSAQKLKKDIITFVKNIKEKKKKKSVHL